MFTRSYPCYNLTENTSKYKFVHEGIGISFMMPEILIMIMYEANLWIRNYKQINIYRKKKIQVLGILLKMTNNKNILILQKQFFCLSLFAINNSIKNVKSTHWLLVSSVTFLIYASSNKHNHSGDTLFSHPVNTELQIASTLNYFSFQEVMVHKIIIFSSILNSLMYLIINICILYCIQYKVHNTFKTY